MGVAVAITYSRLSSERRITGTAGAARCLCGGPVGAEQLHGGPERQADRAPGHHLHRPARRHGAGVACKYCVSPRPRCCRRSTSSPREAPPPAPSGTTPRRRRPSGPCSTYVMWTPAPFDLNAAVTSLGGMDKAGGSGVMNGVDACGAMPPIPGVAVATGGGVTGTSLSGTAVATNYTGATGPIDGNPDNVPSVWEPPARPVPAKDRGRNRLGRYCGRHGPAGRVRLPTMPGPPRPDGPVAGDPGEQQRRRRLHPSRHGKGILIVTGNLIISGSNGLGRTRPGRADRSRSNGNNTTRGAVDHGPQREAGSDRAGYPHER